MWRTRGADIVQMLYYLLPPLIPPGVFPQTEAICPWPAKLIARLRIATPKTKCIRFLKMSGSWKAGWVGPPLTFPFAATSAGGGGGGLLCKCGCDLINRRAKWLSQSRLESITVISLSARSRFPPALQLSARLILNPHPFPLPHQPGFSLRDGKTE